MVFCASNKKLLAEIINIFLPFFWLEKLFSVAYDFKLRASSILKESSEICETSALPAVSMPRLFIHIQMLQGYASAFGHAKKWIFGQGGLHPGLAINQIRKIAQLR